MAEGEEGWVVVTGGWVAVAWAEGWVAVAGAEGWVAAAGGGADGAADWAERCGREHKKKVNRFN